MLTAMIQQYVNYTSSHNSQIISNITMATSCVYIRYLQLLLFTWYTIINSVLG